MRLASVLCVAAISGALCCACTPVREKRIRPAANSGSQERAGASAAGAGGSAGAAEDLKTEEREPDSAGRGGAGGAAGEMGSAAGAKSSESTAGGGAGTAPASSEPGSSGGAAPSSGGESGNTEPTPGAVRGTLIDARGRPLANISLRVADKSVTTDDLGKFSLERAPEKYDVAFKLTTTVERLPTTYAWRFEGLTRRDPTLQVYPAAEQQLASLLWHTQGPTFPLAENQRMTAGFGSSDGDFAVGVNTADYDSPLVVWSGPETTAGVTHGLLYTVSGDDELPLQYLAHDSKPVTLTLGGKLEASFNLSTTSLPMGEIAGRVTAPGQGTRQNWVVLRWADGTAFLLGAETTPADTFSYRVPIIPNASLAVLAFRGRTSAFPYAVAYADNLTGGQTGVQLTVPQVPTLSAPGAGMAGVVGTTEFKWTGDAKVFLFVARATVGADAMFVVTGAKSTTLPIGDPTAYTPGAGSEFEWHVETHGDHAGIDAACGGEGFISAFFGGSLHGPKRGPGSFAASETRSFVTPP